MNQPNKRALWLTAAGLGALCAVRSALRRRRAIDLRDRVVLITGGSRGLGLVLARQLAREGARLAICARDPEELEHARTDLKERGAEVVTVPCDLTDKGQVERMVREVRDRLGAIEVLINNAGVIEVGPVSLMTFEDYEEALNTHFWAPLYTTLAVLPEMRERHQGRIVNISSIGGRVSVPHLLPYSASKFALAGFSEGLRAELANNGILVTTVFPGLMRTGSPPNAIFKGQHRAEYAWFSISDALPLLTMSAERAARKIIDACKHGDAVLVLTVAAKFGVMLHGLFPGLTADVLDVVNRLLPRPGGIGTGRARGRDSTSSLSPSWLTTLSDRATRRNNENFRRN